MDEKQLAEYYQDQYGVYANDTILHNKEIETNYFENMNVENLTI